MILGVGCDIVNNSRVANLSKGAKEKFLTLAETKEYLNDNMSDSDSERLASVFAVKEAVSKAFRVSLFELGAKNIEVKKNKYGAPYVVLSPVGEEVLKKHNVCEYYNVHVSLSHERECSIAFVVVESI